MAVCVGCARKPQRTGNLCDNCARRLLKDPALCPEQILSGGGSANALLVDQWGRGHRLQKRTLIGRDVEACQVSVFQGSISRQHAEILRDDATGLWMIRDLDSTNGTSVDLSRVHALLPLTSPATIFIGDVGFIFVETDETDLRTSDAAIRVTAQREQVAHPDALPRIPMRLVEPSGGGGGLVEIDSQAIQLTSTQFDLFRMLADRMLADHDQPDAVRGFIPTAELLAAISWDTDNPADNHVKQLVRRVRRVLAKAGYDALIESRHRFGYRLRAVPM